MCGGIWNLIKQRISSGGGFHLWFLWSHSHITASVLGLCKLCILETASFLRLNHVGQIPLGQEQVPIWRSSGLWIHNKAACVLVSSQRRFDYTRRRWFWPKKSIFRKMPLFPPSRISFSKNPGFRWKGYVFVGKSVNLSELHFSSSVNSYSTSCPRPCQLKGGQRAWDSLVMSPKLLFPTLKERKGSEFYLHMDLVCIFLEIPFLLLDLF